jgi:hypothetical protein
MKYGLYYFSLPYLSFFIFVPHTLGFRYTSSVITPSRVFKTSIGTLIRRLRISVRFGVPSLGGYTNKFYSDFLRTPCIRFFCLQRQGRLWTRSVWTNLSRANRVSHVIAICITGAQPGWDTFALQSGLWRRSRKRCHFRGVIPCCSNLQFWQFYTAGGFSNWGQFLVFVLLKLHPGNCGEPLWPTSSIWFCG